MKSNLSNLHPKGYIIVTGTVVQDSQFTLVIVLSPGNVLINLSKLYKMLCDCAILTALLPASSFYKFSNLMNIVLGLNKF